MQFDFVTVPQILFGEGRASEAGKLAEQYGKRVLLIRGSSASRMAPVISSFGEKELLWEDFSITGEPTVDIVRQGVEKARTLKCDSIVAVGGGSVLDAGKAIGALATSEFDEPFKAFNGSSNEGDILDFLEMIGKGKALTKPGLPVIAIPTTAGTGAEVTRNAVIGSPEHKLKVSLRSKYVLPAVAIIDPLLTISLPERMTAYSGMDALTQLIEPYVSNHANPLTDALCREGMDRVGRSLKVASHEGRNQPARTDMCIASLFGGLALANAKLGVVHGFAGVLGGRYPAPHGAICARLLPVVTKINVRALKERQSESTALYRYDQIAAFLTGRQDASALDGIAWLEEMNDELEIPQLSRFGVHGSEVDKILDQVEIASSTQGNPIRLNRDELKEIFLTAL